MSANAQAPADAAIHLVDRRPRVAPDKLIAELVPPPHFTDVSFDSYRPDPAQPTQAAAVDALRRFEGTIGAKPGLFGKLFGARKNDGKAGVYLDGGYGVGKTHLLASLWNAAPKPAAFGTFVEFTNLVGALGFHQALEALSEMSLVCVDEFELDDPGDTVLMSRLMRELADAGVKLAATSNTLPDALGEGRFAAQDFLREIQVLSSQFEVLHIDGDDYRHRGLPSPPDPPTPEEFGRLARRLPQERNGVAVDEFDGVLGVLEQIHPSRYRALVDGVRTVLWRGVHTVDNEAVALRLVVLIDRLYDREVTVIATGDSLDHLVTDEMLAGGYKKKYLRAISRLTALVREGETSLR
ncbi:cell division protein ZapE [Spelaeicoccus albus]|uniref:Cell division protein ZapE n=1 Tax=Spelaeicoccus albus TaxID=1280376 RepID=A0A7Z0D4G8_9MICO|nr:cell division protein ZapE [Spelaeicoccus albus]